MPELPAGPASLTGVKTHLSIEDSADDVRLQAIVAAVNAQVSTWPAGARLEAGDFAPNVTEGANMLAARLYRRKDSPAGVAAFGDMGPVYVQRNDPDISMLLGLGAWQLPAVG